jgi:hypothetical protein
VGGQENPKSGTQSSKSSPLFKILQAYQKYENPEDQEENWEEDTTDTEIMKNINSLLDSGKQSLCFNE